MRVRTDGKYAYRQDEIEWASEFWECNKTEAIMRSIEFTRQMNRNLIQAIEHPDMTPELAERLSTSEIKLCHEIQTEVRISE